MNMCCLGAGNNNSAVYTIGSRFSSQYQKALSRGHNSYVLPYFSIYAFFSTGVSKKIAYPRLKIFANRTFGEGRKEETYRKIRTATLT